MICAFKQRSVLPGFGLAMGFTLLYLSLLVLIPLGGTFLKTASMTWAQFWQAVTAPRALASYRLTFGASFIAALINVVFGLIVAWVLVRYKFSANVSSMRWWICRSLCRLPLPASLSRLCIRQKAGSANILKRSA